MKGPKPIHAVAERKQGPCGPFGKTVCGLGWWTQRRVWEQYRSTVGSNANLLRVHGEGEGPKKETGAITCARCKRGAT